MSTPITRRHTQRLRQMFRSAGWPFQDLLEAELLAAGLLERVPAAAGCDTLRVTDAGVAAIGAAAERNRAALSAHEQLVRQVAAVLAREGRIAWRGLSLRVALGATDSTELDKENLPQVSVPSSSVAIKNEFEEATSGVDWLAPALKPPVASRWCMACPDVFSVRHTSVEAYLQPAVHEIKVSRADLLGDLKRSDKRAAYLRMAGACTYVLGEDARGRAIGAPDEVPAECGVVLVERGRLIVARPAPRQPLPRLPFGTWMALARATPWRDEDDEAQAPLSARDV